MRDSRLKQCKALLDDARALLVDIVDDGPIGESTIRDFNWIDAGRQFINSAIQYVQYATDPETAA